MRIEGPGMRPSTLGSWSRGKKEAAVAGEGMQGSEPLSRARGPGRQEAEAEKSE